MEPFAAGRPLGVVHEVVRAAQRGEPAAMDELVRALAPYVGRVCGAIALDRGDDAVQETFIAVLRGLRGLREPAALHGWVRRIAVREAVRQATRDGRIVTGADLDAAAPVPDLDAALDVRAALAALRPEHRAVLVLRDLDGLSEADVAELLSVPEGTVKSRLHRARAAAREVLSR
jgi:RNA polymerase sigma-70 factor (ECF subfamily)